VGVRGGRRDWVGSSGLRHVNYVIKWLKYEGVCKRLIDVGDTDQRN
jgi:hypothetical protein